jgi:hypothetical protein
VLEVTFAVLRRFGRAAIVIVTALMGLTAIIPGWTMISSGTVGGYKLPADWFSSYAPFSDFLVPGLILLVVIGLGGVLTAVLNIVSADLGSFAALVYGLVLIGWILGELVFMTQTMLLTWVILGAGLVLVALAAPRVLPALRQRLGRQRGQPAI